MWKTKKTKNWEINSHLLYYPGTFGILENWSPTRVGRNRKFPVRPYPSPCFMPSPQSAVRSPQFAVLVLHYFKFKFFTLFTNRLKSTNNACSIGMRDDVLLLPKQGQFFCLQTGLWIALRVSGEQLQGILHFQNNETEDMLAHITRPFLLLR